MIISDVTLLSINYHHAIIVDIFQPNKIFEENFQPFMESVLDRICKLCEKEGITITALEKKIGASKGVLSRAIAKKTDILSKWTQLIVDNFPQYSATWLLTGNGEMFRDNQSNLVKEPPAPYGAPTPPPDYKEEIQRLSALLVSQQKTIENLSETLRKLIEQ